MQTKPTVMAVGAVLLVMELIITSIAALVPLQLHVG